jgi:D(-)-tartrate dehydratase
MRITGIKVAEAPIASSMSNAVIDFSKMTVSVVAIETDATVDGQPVVGYGFNSNGRYAQTGILNERILPRLRSTDPEVLCDAETGLLDPVAARSVMLKNEKPGGHGDRAVAVGVVDMALWDAVSKAAGKPFFRVLHERFGVVAEPAESVWVYAAGGYYHPGGSLDDLRDEMRSYLDLGYVDLKLKIGGATLAEDLERIEAVLGILPSGSRLAVDANGLFKLRQALAYAKALDAYDLLWYEEPCDPLDYAAHATLAEAYPGRLATGENLFSVQEVRNLLRHGGLRPHLDTLQMDPALCYGVSEYVAMLRELSGRGWSTQRCCPHGGHQYNLGIAAAFGLGGCESYPKVFQPFGGFADAMPVEAGRVRLPETPGIGIESKAALRDVIHRLFH